MRRLSVDMASRIDRLRAAAKEHGEVHELLQALAASFELERAPRNRSRISATGYVYQRHASAIEAAMHAAAFAAVDRYGKEG